MSAPGSETAQDHINAIAQQARRLPGWQRPSAQSIQSCANVLSELDPAQIKSVEIGTCGGIDIYLNNGHKIVASGSTRGNGFDTYSWDSSFTSTPLLATAHQQYIALWVAAANQTE